MTVSEAYLKQHFEVKPQKTKMENTFAFLNTYIDWPDKTANKELRKETGEESV